MEITFTQEFAEYSGTSDINTEQISLFQTQKIVHQIYSETGAKPALLYVRFAPTSMSGISDNDPLELILVTSDGSPLRKVLPATRAEGVHSILHKVA